MSPKPKKKIVKADREIVLNGLREIFDEFMRVNGMKMTKKISSGGFLSSPTYDIRTVHNRKDEQKLIKEGFSAGSDLGWFIYNMIMTKL